MLLKVLLNYPVSFVPATNIKHCVYTGYLTQEGHHCYPKNKLNGLIFSRIHNSLCSTLLGYRLLMVPFTYLGTHFKTFVCYTYFLNIYEKQLEDFYDWFHLNTSFCN